MKILASDLFAAGTRIIGILAIIKAIMVLIMTVPSLFGHNYPGWALSQQIMTLVYPLALLLIGIYLISCTSRLVRKFYPEEEDTATESAQAVFLLAMKITGMVLIVYFVPDLLRILSNALYIGYYRPMGIDTIDQQLLVAERSLAMLVTILLGFYLLNGGRFFARLAFKNKDSEN
ncbi:MAG: hypothetical protein GXY40_10470 [Syntrophomonadaceae bacterium]|jgi:Na+-transporting methylmalonyl-CoA/oxaloacetate decarboxylase gamma subunit|nr:hypothetical protein [Syntrophomonadaceae bacterium]